MRPIVDVDPWRSLALAIATSEQRQRLLNCHAYLHTRNPFAGHSDRVPARNRWPNDAHRAHLSGKRAGIEQGEADASAVVVETRRTSSRYGSLGRTHDRDEILLACAKPDTVGRGIFGPRV